MLRGYARVSIDEQDTVALVAALKAAGCKRIYREKASGERCDRPGFIVCLDQLRNGDMVVVCKVVCKLDWLSHSFRDVLILWSGLARRKRVSNEPAGRQGSAFENGHGGNS